MLTTENFNETMESVHFINSLLEVNKHLLSKYGKLTIMQQQTFIINHFRIAEEINKMEFFTGMGFRRAHKMLWSWFVSLNYESDLITLMFDHFSEIMEILNK